MPRLRPFRRDRRLSIAAYLGLGIGGLTFVAVGGVLVMMLWASWLNTSELLRDKSRLLLGSLVAHTGRYLDPAVAQAGFLARLIESGELDPADQQALLDTLRAVLAATPQIHGAAFFAADGSEAVAVRHDDDIEQILGTWRNDPITAEVMARQRERGGAAHWGPPVWVDRPGTVLNLRQPVLREGAFLGLVVSVVRIAELSAFLAELETEFGQLAFILYDHDYVLAHRALEFEFEGLSPERPLPRVTEVGDPVLFNIWREGWQERSLLAGSGHHDRLAGREYVYLYAPLLAYGEQPWLVGSYFAQDDIAMQLTRMVRAAVAGLLVLVLAVALAWLLGRLLRRPIDQLALAALEVRKLDLDRVARLPRSRFRELDEAQRAFNAMLAALQAFALYVPQRLVLRLIARGDVAALRSETREVSVLFTDIVDFTGRTERLPARDTAAFLNHHFGLLTACIEAEQGTVDKYIGDAVMALWGAVEDQPDHPVRAVRAAAAIAAALSADNRGRESPVRLRIGVHSGSVVVGNIGTASRMNYTVVGDAVNVAQRLEKLAGELVPDTEVAVLVSEETARRLPGDIRLRPLGRHRLRGRGAPAEVLTLTL
jgi:adenylate cyclase